MTASLSAVHLLGFTLLSGAAFVLHLRLMGAMLRRAAVAEIARTASVLIALGLVISIVTGSLLFAGRATSIAPNGIFQAKMALFVLAVLWQVPVQRRLALATPLSPSLERVIGFVGLAVWLSLAATACAFILLE
jgi:hypothetical protein